MAEADNERMDDPSTDLGDKVNALEADIKEIYKMLAQLQTGVATDNKFTKLSLEKKILQVNERLLQTAKQAGILLPR